MRPHLRLGLALAVLFALGAASARAADPLKIIPRDAEVLISVKVGEITQSEVFQKALERNPSAKAQLQALQNLTGLDLTQDLKRVTAFGQMNNKNISGVIAEGTFDEQKLITLIKTKQDYQTTTTEGRTIHQWRDRKDKAAKFGVIDAAEGVAVIWNSQAALEASLAALKDESKSFVASPDMALIPPNAQDALAGILVVSREQRGPAAKYHVNALVGMLTTEQNQVTLRVSVHPTDAADTPKWVDLAKGAAALGQLQPDNRELQQLASQAVVEAAPDGKSATLTLSVDRDKLISALERKAGKRKQ